MTRLKGSIELTKYAGASIEERMFNGQVVECISIPIDINGFLKRGKDRVFLGFMCLDRKPNPYRITHAVTPRMNNARKEELERMGFYDDMRFVGMLANYNNNYWANKHDDGKKHVSIEEAMKID